MGNGGFGMGHWGLAMGNGNWRFGIRYKKREQDAPTTDSYITPNS